MPDTICGCEDIPRYKVISDHTNYSAKMVMWTYRRFVGGITRTQLETFKFGFCLLTPILVMYWVGIDSDKKFNLPGFWPDPQTLNQVPKEPHEIQAEVARIRRARAEKRSRLEAKAKELGITEDDA